jgi:hypothetical protein
MNTQIGAATSGSALTAMTALGFLLSVITVQVLPLLTDAVGWRATVPLALSRTGARRAGGVPARSRLSHDVRTRDSRTRKRHSDGP